MKEQSHCTVSKINSGHNYYRECTVCLRVFLDQADLDNHRKLVHADIGKEMIQDTPMEINEAKHNQVGTDKIDCSVCEEKYDNITKYTHHLNSHLQIVGHPIEDVPESIGNGKYRLEVDCKTDLELPTKSGNLLTQPSDALSDKGDVFTYDHEIDARILFSCTMCDKFFASKYDLTQHIDLVHISSQFNCSLCKKQFSSKHHVQRHIDSVHKKLKPFSCTKCQKSFAEKHNLDRHVNLIHKKFNSEQSRNIHTIWKVHYSKWQSYCRRKRQIRLDSYPESFRMYIVWQIILLCTTSGETHQISYKRQMF